MLHSEYFIVMKSGNFEKQEIQKYVDSLLKPEEARRIEKIISASPEAQEYYLKLLQQKQLLNIWWKNFLN